MALPQIDRMIALPMVNVQAETINPSPCATSNCKLSAAAVVDPLDSTAAGAETELKVRVW